MTSSFIKGLLFLFLLALFLLTPEAPARAAAADCDSLIVLKQSSYGCTNFRLKNRNAQRETITRFWLELVTPGLTWEGTAFVDNWTVVQLAPNILEVSGTGTNLRAGVELTISNVCLGTVCQSGGDYTVRFKTFNQGTLVCTGNVTLNCDRLDPRDSLSIAVNSTNINCYDMSLANHNSAFLPLNGFEISPLSPNVQITGTSANGWTVQPGLNENYRFRDATSYIGVGSSLDKFKLCFDQVPAGQDTVTLLWKSFFNNLAVTIDTLRFRLARASRCDSIATVYTLPGDGSACHIASLFNRHEPTGAISSITLQMRSPNVVFLTGATGPWPLAQETSIFLRYASAGAGILSGDSIKGFSFCMLNSGISDTVTLRLTTTDAGKENCSSDFRVYCPVSSASHCDRFTFNRLSGDSYRLGIVNRRQPSLPVNSLTIDILNSGPTFDSAVAPVNWILADSTASGISFSTSLAPLGPGGSTTGFFARFGFSGQEDSVVLQFCTSFNGQSACCDTLVLPLSGMEIRCDSLLLEKSGSGSCSYRTGFKNTHVPTSETTVFTIRALANDITMQLPDPPKGWTVLADGFSGEISLQRATAITDSLSFEMEFTSTTPDGSMFLEWCTEDANGIICCGIDSVQCEPITHCDLLEQKPGNQEFQRDVRMRNDHQPASTIDAIRIAITTPGATIDSVSLPAGWTYTASVASDSLVIIPEPAIAPDSTSSWFTLFFAPAPGCDSIRYNWCTEHSDSVLCCDDAEPIACALPPCDTLRVETDPVRPCCFDFAVRNGAGGEIDRLTLRMLTPGAVSFTSTAITPTGWDASSDTVMQTWMTITSTIKQGMEQSGFTLCYDNNAIENRSFRVLWETYTGRTVRCSDTLTIACDRTLSVERLDGPLPREAALQQNFPNPFTTQTQMVFSLAHEENVSLQVFDTHGRQVASLCEGRYPAGNFRVHFDAGSLPAGTYLLRMHTEHAVLTRLMMLVK